MCSIYTESKGPRARASGRGRRVCFTANIPNCPLKGSTSLLSQETASPRTQRPSEIMPRAKKGQDMKNGDTVTKVALPLEQSRSIPDTRSPRPHAALCPTRGLSPGASSFHVCTYMILETSLERKGIESRQASSKGQRKQMHRKLSFGKGREEGSRAGLCRNCRNWPEIRAQEGIRPMMPESTVTRGCDRAL